MFTRNRIFNITITLLNNLDNFQIYFPWFKFVSFSHKVIFLQRNKVKCFIEVTAIIDNLNGLEF